MINRRQIVAAIASAPAALGAMAAGAHHTSLEAAIETHIKSLRRRGVLGPDIATSWSVYDFTTNQKLVTINEDHPRQCASLVKPLVALAFFDRVKERKLYYGPKSRGKLQKMIAQSDNAATNWMMDVCGGPTQVNRILNRRFGGILQNTRIVERIPANGRTYRNMASAHDYSRFLYALWNKQLPYSSEILRVMKIPNSDFVYRGASAVKKGTKVFDKTGTTASLSGNIAVLVGRDGRGRTYPYTLIGILERSRRSNNFNQWRRDTRRVIREVSNLTYRHMAGRHGLG